MKRREFIALVSGVALASPLAAGAQQPTMPVIGFLNAASAAEWVHLVAAFKKGLNEAGYDEGQNVAIEYRWAEGHYDRLPVLAGELVHRPVTVLVATGGFTSARAAKKATATIPIVFTSGADPVKYGLVASLNRPGGNLTGVSVLTTELEPKRLELLRELVPNANVIAVLLNPKGAAAEYQLQWVQAAAGAIGQQIYVLNASREGDIDAAFTTLIERHAGALVVGADPFFVSRRHQIAALAARHAVPTIYRLVGVYTGKILKGAKPADLPIQQSTKLELVINLRVAKALGLTIPQSILLRADEVIE